MSLISPRTADRRRAWRRGRLRPAARRIGAGMSHVTAAVAAIAAAGALLLSTGCAPKGTGPEAETRARAESPAARRPVVAAALPIREPGRVATTLGEVEAVESGATFVRLRVRNLDEGQRRQVVLALALPPGREPVAEFESLRIRQTGPWDTEGLDDQATSAALGPMRHSMNRLVTVSDRGLARRTTLGQLTISTEVSGGAGGRRYGLTEAGIVVRWAEPWTPAETGDPAYRSADSPWMQTLGGLVVNPSALAAYAAPEPVAPEVEPAYGPREWQPEPVGQGPGGGWLKLPVEAEGLYAIDWHTLKDSGWDPDTVEPTALRVFNEGVEAPTLVVGGLAKKFTIRDRLVFWGRPSPSPMTRENAYFVGLAAEGRQPLRFAQNPAPSGTAFAVADDWPVVTRIEENNLLETKEGNFLSIRDMKRVWRLLPSGEPVTVSFDLPGHAGKPLPGKDVCYIRILFYVGKGGAPSGAGVEATLNGTVRGSIQVAGPKTDPALAMEVPAGVLREEGNEIEIRWQGGEAKTQLFLDAIEAHHLRRADVSHGPMLLELKDRPTTGSLALRVEGAGANEFLALNLADPLRPIRLPVARESGEKGLRVLIDEGREGRIGLFPLSQAPAAAAGRPAAWRPWRSDSPEADSLLIAHRDFLPAAERIAEVWKAEGWTPEVVDVESLYDAYTLGLLDPAAIKLFLRDALTRWPKRPQAALLIGDATSDARNEAQNQVLNYVPTHSRATRGVATQDRYASDLWFARLFGEDEFADLLIGRLSVASVEDAEAAAAKQIEARRFPTGIWTRTVGLVADHGSFADVCEDLRFKALFPTVLPRLAYLDREPFEDNFYLPAEALEGDEVKVSPATTRRIQEVFEKGAAVISFFGHGSPNIWSDQRIWFGGDTPNSDNRRLKNGPFYPLVFNGTCNTGAFDYPVRPWNVCISEDMMRQPGGGALACFVPSAPGYTSNHKTLADALFRGAFLLSVRRIGPLCELARMSYQMLESHDDHSQMFILLGDPLASLPKAQARTGRLSRASDGLRLEAAAEGGTAARRGERFVIRPDGELLHPPVRLDPSGAGTAGNSGEEMEGWIQVIEWREGDGGLGTGAAAGGRRDDRVVGAAEFLGPRVVSVRSLAMFREPGAAQGPGSANPTFLAVLENLSRAEAEGVLVLKARSGSGDWETAESAKFRIPAKERRTACFNPTLAPGVHLLRAEIQDSVSVIQSPRDSSRPLAHVVTRPGVARDVAAAILSVDPLTTAQGDLALNIQAAVANLGAETWAGSEVRIADPSIRVVKPRKPGDEPADGAGTAPREEAGLRTMRIVQNSLRAGEYSQVTFSNIGVPKDKAVEWLVEPVVDGAEWEDENPDNNAARFSFDPASLPDLAFIPDSFSIIPDSPTEGETVFLRAEVENRGHSPTGEFTVAGFAYNGEGKETAMKDRASLSTPLIPPLAAGERREVRARWDPARNLDTETVALVADPTFRTADPDRENNRIAGPIRVRSKWKLVPAGITIADRSTTSVLLVARIRNEGESPARFVEVAFYPDDNHAKENRLGTDLVDVIEPEKTAAFRFVWSISPEFVGRQVRPSYEAYIKGSLLRVTGTSGE